MEGTKIVINSTIIPNMKFTKASQKFGQWSDVKANTVYGLAFSSELELNKFSEKFNEVRLDAGWMQAQVMAQAQATTAVVQPSLPRLVPAITEDKLQCTEVQNTKGRTVLAGTPPVINSAITPNMTFTNTSQKFDQRSDVRANTVNSMPELNKFREKIGEAKEATPRLGQLKTTKPSGEN